MGTSCRISSHFPKFRKKSHGQLLSATWGKMLTALALSMFALGAHADPIGSPTAEISPMMERSERLLSLMVPMLGLILGFIMSLLADTLIMLWRMITVTPGEEPTPLQEIVVIPCEISMDNERHVSFMLPPVSCCH